MSKSTRHRHDTSEHSLEWRQYVNEHWSPAEEEFEADWRLRVALVLDGNNDDESTTSEGLIEACEQLLIRYWDDMQAMVKLIRGKELVDSEVTSNLLWDIYQGLAQICYDPSPIRATVNRIWLNTVLRELDTDPLDTARPKM